MKRALSILYVLAAIAGSVLPPRTVRAQAPPKIERIAEQTAKKIAKTQPRAILTTFLAGCLGAPDLCGEFDEDLRAALEKAIPGVQFIRREKALSHLAEHAFLSVDAYLGALDAVSADAGAEVVIGEDFRRKRTDCALRTTVVDTKHLYELGESVTGIPCSAVPINTMTSLVKDPQTGISLIVVLPRPPGASQQPSLIRFPSCVTPADCPGPHYTGSARQRGLQGSVRILLTVTERGTVEDARAVGAVDESLARASVDAVSGWHLRPAIGPDGKPFQARIQVEMNFKLLPR